MNFKIVIPIFFLFLIFGCTVDIEGFVKELPQVKSFLADYPNADIKVSLLDENIVRERIDQLEDACGFPPPIKDYYFVTVEDPPETIYVLLTRDTEVQCLVRFGSGNPAPDVDTTESSTPDTSVSTTSSTTTDSDTTTTDSDTSTSSTTTTSSTDSDSTGTPIGYVTGTMTDEQGNPVQGVVYLVELDGANWDHVIAESLTGSEENSPRADGSFELMDVEPGIYRILALSDTKALFSQIINISEVPFVFNPSMIEGVPVTIQVMDSSNPVETADIRFIQDGLLIWSAKTDSRGIYDVPELSTGHYELLASKSDALTGPVFAFAELDVPQTTSKTLQFPSLNASVIVSVKDSSTGEIISDSSVELRLKSRYSFAHKIVSSSGEYAFTGLPAAEYELLATALGYEDSSQMIQLNNQAEESIEIRMVRQ
ncbi:MAG: carboxypeptidase-like regulatory domain-containing protein [Candidatus Diapherotrites archaeon]|nr:carboxypeptidase-like regulatory domain-containing protein [Candidatus Diapherotrites archaeon]